MGILWNRSILVFLWIHLWHCTFFPWWAVPNSAGWLTCTFICSTTHILVDKEPEWLCKTYFVHMWCDFDYYFSSKASSSEPGIVYSDLKVHLGIWLCALFASKGFCQSANCIWIQHVVNHAYNCHSVYLDPWIGAALEIRFRNRIRKLVYIWKMFL